MASPYVEVHKPENLRGPGDARPTALQILKDQDLLGKLEGKVALVTGVSSGLGIETVRALRAAGMHVFGAVRDLQKATAALQADLEPGRLELLPLDNASLVSVRACAAAFLAKSDKLHVLVNNAGVMMTPEGRTADGFETQFAVNHLAHFLLFQLLRPTLLATAVASPEFGVRVVNVSSSAHLDAPGIFFDNPNLEGIYTPQLAYAQSKLANIQIASETERRYGAQGVHAWSVMPGGIATGLAKYLPQDLIESWAADEEFMRKWKNAGQRAATQVRACVARELEGKGGVYLEDCWEAGESVEGVPHVGYKEGVFDEESGRRLWEMSCRMVGVEDE
ncbi:NAD(P)-binding protein [Bimuria novae-zelandiae CBS 107.79]|uniref:NAD(P)-binding protein n=1 Tax=Bimuria novae-zelandiae CBS 107.79 TaxID=1447943 RepID=A0A6A5VLP2_9PLEO|nr:NAD(P)-binding protein [Bimuria novae-zelandiae CBS 107.79]